jgi:hypothetical protein
VRETSKHQLAFEAWYAAGRQTQPVAAAQGIAQRTLRTWSQAFDWHELADARDREAAVQAERAAIEQRLKVLEEQRQAGELLRRRGVQYLTKAQLDNAADAIRAIKEGVALERSAAGMPDYLIQVMTMSEDELRDDLDRLRRATAGMAPAPALADAAGADGPQRRSELAGDRVDEAGPVLSP